jgi:ketosteroid isomerase-like protein
MYEMGTEQNRAIITRAFEAWLAGDSGPFFGLVAESIRWTVIGSTPVSGCFTTRAVFFADAFSQLMDRLDGGIRLKRVQNILADGDHVVVQFESASRAKSGMPYEQSYCWVLRLAGGEIVEATAYLDTELVAALFKG